MSVLNSTQIIKAKIGSTAEFVCYFKILSNYESNASDSKIWLKENSGVISINNQIKLNKKKYSVTNFNFENKNSSYTLTIKNVQVQDNGKYICQHFDFSIMKYFYLSVLGKSSFIYHKNSLVLYNISLNLQIFLKISFSN